MASRTKRAPLTPDVIAAMKELEGSPVDYVAIQMYLNTAACMAENATMMRALVAKRKRKRGTDEAQQALSDGAPASETKPKRARSGYNLFLVETRPRVVSSNASMTPQEAMRQVGAAWKDLTPQEKTGYNERAKAEASSTPPASKR